MIIVKLMGGLGNQMFQYAAGRRLAHRHGVALKLDHSFLESGRHVATPRHYELHHLQIRCSRATVADCKVIAQSGLSAGRRWWLSIRPVAAQLERSTRRVRERSLRFDPALFDLGDNVYLDGYWASERYFLDIADLLREELAVREPLSGENLRIAEEIAGCAAVSLHVRRGDYVSDPGTAAFHGVCGVDYYARAIDRIAANESALRIFVFSDDIAWAREHLRTDFPMTFVSHNPPGKGYEDLRLMSLCRHHIIANSSFSWWGAWLNPRPDKLVVAPQRWFNTPDADVADILPESWLKL